MLNGVDPIIIFEFKRLIPDIAGFAKLPVAGANGTTIPLPFIPLYLSEKLTGIYIDQEGKNIDVDTTILADSAGSAPPPSQRPLSNTVTINMKASRDSIGISLLSALSDLIVPKLVSREYSITYLHGAIVVFSGLLHSLSIDQNAENDLYNIALSIIKPPADQKTPVPIVGKVTGATPL